MCCKYNFIPVLDRENSQTNPIDVVDVQTEACAQINVTEQTAEGNFRQLTYRKIIIFRSFVYVEFKNIVKGN